ncbi:MAG: C2H2-type zinc finger protein [Candidatus Babeliales bacterium]
MPGQSAQSLTDGQQQLATGANSFAFQMPPPPPPPFLFPPIPLPGQPGSTFTLGQQQLTPGANSFAFQMPPPPPPPFLFPPIPLAGQSAQSLTDGQQQVTTGANSFLFEMPPQLPGIEPVLPPASTVSIPPLPTTTVAPIRTTADQNQPHELHQVEGFSINSDGNYQCTHTGCDTIIETIYRDTLIRHQRTHRISYQCSQCGYDGKSRSENVKRHIKNHKESCPDAVVEKVILNESTVQGVTCFTKTPDGFTKTADGKYQCMHPGCRQTISEKATTGTLMRHKKMHNEAPFLPPSLTSSAPDQTEDTDQAKEQEFDVNDAFIAQLLSEPLPETLGISSVMPGPLNSQESDQLPAPLAPQITQGQEVENRFGIQHAPAPLADQTLAGNLDLDDAFIAALLREQPQQGRTDHQSQQQQPFTVGFFTTAANLLPSQITPPQPFFGQQPFTVGSLAEDRIRLRLRQIEAFINSYTYKNAPPHLKQKTLADFTASLDGSIVPVTQTIGSATSNVSPVDLPPKAFTAAALAQKKSFQCDLCEKSFTSELNLKRHRATDHAPQLLQKNTSGSAAREDHSTDVSVTAAQSDENPGEFDDFIEKFSNTIIKPDGTKSYSCTFPDCVQRNLVPKEFTGKSNSFTDHMINHFSKFKEIYQCPVCKRSFTAKSSLDRHLKSDNVHQLRLPSERSKINLSDKLKEHFTQEDSQIICKQCNKQFSLTSSLTTLSQHKDKHLKNYKCSVCENIYFYLSDARKHTRNVAICNNAEILVVNLTSTAPSASNQQEFLDDDDIVIDDDE